MLLGVLSCDQAEPFQISEESRPNLSSAVTSDIARKTTGPFKHTSAPA
jgi:hypothetical protein